MSSPGQSVYKLSFQLSPIILTDGIASFVPGGMLPIISITESINFTLGLLNGAQDVNLDDFFAHFQPLPGSTLIDQQIGMYPFANQAVAANAVIADPLRISLQMICPARGPSGYASKLATMLALQAALAQHNASGGTYTIATPSFFYTSCVMTGMKDTSSSGSRQAQNTWQLDFVKPLLTLAAAQQAQNSLMSKISGGVPIAGEPAWSGLPPTVGNPSSLAGPSLIPAASGPAGAGNAAVTSFQQAQR